MKLEIFLGVRGKDKHDGKLIKNFRLSAKCLQVCEKKLGKIHIKKKLMTTRNLRFNLGLAKKWSTAISQPKNLNRAVNTID